MNSQTDREMVAAYSLHSFSVQMFEILQQNGQEKEINGTEIRKERSQIIPVCKSNYTIFIRP